MQCRQSRLRDPEVACLHHLSICRMDYRPYSPLLESSIAEKSKTLGGFTVVSGVLISIIVCAVMPKSNGAPYASTYSIWSDWQNQTGYTSNGFVFMLGMLNGAFSVGTPDVVTHLAEEVPQYVLSVS